MNDALTSLIAAYREENVGASLDARALRRRVLAAAQRRRHQRSRRLAFLIPIAAVLVGSGALAATAPARAHVVHLVAWLSALSAVERPAPATPPVSAHRPPHPNSPPLPAPGAPTLAPTPELPLPPPPAPAPAPRAADFSAPRSASGLRSSAPVAQSVPAPVTHSASPRSPSPSPPALPAASDPAAPAVASASVSDPALAADVSAYRAAHRLHFVSANYGQALTAWNAYLSRFPAGTFAPEARLNRAVCLARLGHPAEARTALTAIANGRDGQYGRTQAKRLLEALDVGR